MQKYKIRKYLKSFELRLFLIFMMPFVGLFFFQFVRMENE